MPTSHDLDSPTTAVRMSLPLRWPLTLVLGAALVALSAQFAVPLPYSPVPMTLQGLAVIVVGGLAGSAAGAGALVLYLVAGAFGLPVFAMGTSGLLRLIGPSGGYLLAFPLAAALVGRFAERGRFGRCLAAALLGTAMIHIGGLAQLTLLTGSFSRAIALGTTPFLLGDLLKAVLAAVVLRQSAAFLRPRT